MKKQPLIEEVGPNKYRVPYHWMPSVDEKDSPDGCEIRGREYAIFRLPGVTDREKLHGALSGYHKIGEDKVPALIVEGRVLFRVLQRDDYGKDGNIVELVTDVDVAKRVLDSIVRKHGNVFDLKDKYDF